MNNDKDRYWDCLDQAMEASHGGRTEEALAWLDEALKVHPTGAEAHNGRGEILWDEGGVEEALREFERATDADPKFTAAHLNRAELLIEEMAEFELVLQQCDELLSGRPELPRPDRNFQAEIYYLKSKALFYLDDLDGALFLVRRGIKVGGDQPVFRAFEGQILFEVGQFDKAHQVLEHAAALDPESPHAAYHLGLVKERLGQVDEATALYARANALEATQYPMPHEMPDDEFRKVVDEAMENLPLSIREYVDNVLILVEDYPSVEMMTRENVSPQLLGIFIGVPRTETIFGDQPSDLDRVIIFKRNLEKVCRDREELIDQIQVTVRHEVGHFLGLDEDDMERLGLS